MPIYALGTQIQFDNVSCVNFTPESIFVMDKYLTNNDISLKEFITNKDNFVSNDDNYIDEENDHIITDIPKCLVHLMQRSEEHIQKQYNEKIKDTVIKKKEDGTETTIEDEINKNKKVANNGKIVNGTLDYKRQKSIERVIGKKVKIITPDEMCEKLIKYKEKVAHLEKCSTRLEQLDEKLFYMNRYAYKDEYNKGQNQDILIEELDNGERIVYTAAILDYNKTRSEDLEIKTENDKIKEFINNIKYKEFGSNTLKNIDININMYNFKNNCDIIIFVKSLCDKILEGCEFINNKTNEEFNLLLLIEKLSEIYNIEYKELLKTFERIINDKVDSLINDLEKNKKDYNNIYNEYDKCKKLTNNWKNWEEHNLDNLNKYHSVEKTEHEIFLYNDQFNQELNYLTQEENLLMQSEQHNQEKINLIQNQKRLIENQHYYNLNQYQKCVEEENLLMQNKQRNQEKIIQIQNRKNLIKGQYNKNFIKLQQCVEEKNKLTSWYQEQRLSIYQYQQWCNHDKQEIETKLKDSGINEKLENIDKEIRKEKKIIKNIGKYKIGIIRELEKDLNNKNSVDLIYIKLKNNLIINKNIGIKIKEDEIVIDKRNMIINIKRTNSENIYDCMNNYLKNNKIKLGKTEQNIIKDVLNEICKLKVFATITR